MNKEYYDKSMKPIQIHVGNKVLIKEQNKKNSLCKNWTGLFEVTHVHANENITIKKCRIDYRIHKNNVKLYNDA